MEDRTIIVTGSSSGIGRAITETLLEAGAVVIGLARDHHKYDPPSERYKPFEVDLANIDKLSKCVKEVLSLHSKLDGFVGSAGFGLFGNLENFSLEKISHFINSNLTSQIALASFLIPHFKNQQYGDLVFVGSEAGLKGAKKGSLYSAVKFGLRGFTQSIREECAPKNVRVSLINPGMVRTPFFDNLNFAPGDDEQNAIEPRDVAYLVASILSMRTGTVVDEVNLSPQKKVIKFE